MSQYEVTGERDLTYSQVHRPNSLKRYTLNASSFYMLDVDSIEYGVINGISLPLVVKEITTSKVATKTNVASVVQGLLWHNPVNIPFLIVRYTPTEHNLPLEFQTLEPGVMEPLNIKDIKEFNVTLYEFLNSSEPIDRRGPLTPKEYFSFLYELREEIKTNWQKFLRKTKQKP